MDGNNEKPKTFLEELQSLDEPIKRRALVIASGVVMVIVVFVWLGYFNNVVIGNQEQAQNDQTSAPAPAVAQTTSPSTGPSAWHNMEGSMATIYSNFAGMVKDVGHVFQSPRQYNIQPQK